MIEEYSIEVNMTPHTWDNKHKPYFWVIFGIDADGNKSNEGSGWAETPDQAFKDATEYYNLK